jgi:S1-C subfamily serine protease
MNAADRVVLLLRRSSFFAFSAVLLGIAPTALGGDPGPDIYKRGAPGVVRIQVAGVETTSSVNEVGSGFIVTAGGLVLTALHLLPKGVPIDKLVVVGALGPDTSGAAATYVLEVVKQSVTHDAMLMRIVNPPSGLHPLPLRRSAPVPGEQLFVLGH